MGWTGTAPSQTFERTDGTRTGSQTWQEADAASVDIVAEDHDTHDQDIGDGINACLKKDGGNTAGSALPMGGFNHTNVGDATSLQHYLSLKQHMNNVGQYVPTVGGTADVITLTTGFSHGAYVAGSKFSFIAAASNTSTTVTINVDGLGAKTVKAGASAPAVGQIIVSTMITVQYDGTNFQLTSSGTQPASIPVGSVIAWTTGTAPTGLLECDGSSVATATYPELFAVIAYSYGGSGANFNLPDYRGEFLRGFDNSAGTDPDAASRTDRGDGTTGDAVGTKQVSDYKSHTHTFTSDSNGAHTHFIAHDSIGSGATLTDSSYAQRARDTSNDNDYFLSPTGSEADVGLTSSNGAHTHTGTTATAPSSGGNETRPTNVSVMWCIVAIPGAALAVSTVGAVEQWVSAKDCTARSNSPAAAGTHTSGSANFVTVTTFDFDTSSDEFITYQWAPPKRWDGGTVTFIPYWTNASGLTTETLTWAFQGVALSNDDPFNTAYGTAVTSADTWIAQGDVHIGPVTGACTIAGTPADADLVVFQIYRDVSADDLTGDAKLIGFKLIWNADAASDD